MTRTIEEAMKMLKDGNARFSRFSLDHPRQNEKRLKSQTRGQDPYAIILTCSDSRVPPELIFDAGIGDIFVIRNAGNVVDPMVQGTVEYAVGHLGTPVLMVLSHTECGAVGAALEGGDASQNVCSITDKINCSMPKAKDGEGDLYLNLILENMRNSLREFMDNRVIAKAVENGDLKVLGALYHIETGIVEFFN